MAIRRSGAGRPSSAASRSAARHTRLVASRGTSSACRPGHLVDDDPGPRRPRRDGHLLGHRDRVEDAGQRVEPVGADRPHRELDVDLARGTGGHGGGHGSAA